ncbi:M28 family metallopeptidase [Pseudonocardia halophobica]|uniref:Amidohydrolase n=1 Tax=Pseudonocardia halophobica TaxID=29401 RepID=A0A9W6NWG8_9PSEU|nr:M28 family peptidase [Pseudonocardia halophobica]GLL11427.1 amidohydrolase [Pseudonocardia halophobica]
MRGRRLAATVAGLAALVLAGCSAAPTAPAPPSATAVAPDPGLPARLMSTVSGDGAFAHLERLQQIADANGGNRALGTPGYDASVDYVARTLRDAGFTVDTPTFDVRAFSVQDQRLTVEGRTVESTVMSFSPSTPAGGLTAPLHVVAQDATSGCEAEDFAGMPAGAIALVKRGTCPFGAKSENAKRAGAAGLVVVNTENERLDGTLGESTETVPTTGVTASAGADLATKGGTPVTLLLTTTTRDTVSRNVITQTTTGDPNRVVMAGAHLDSVPEGPGINDNGTGTASLLELATALGPTPPVANAVRFAWWGAEELGLVGSTRYVEGLAPADRQKIALYVNLDMVGSPNAGYLVYDGDDSDKQGAGPGPEGSAAVEQVLLEQLSALGVQGSGTDFDGRSDYGPFIAAGIPSGGLFTGAEERKSAQQAQQWGGQADRPYDACYHQACDTTANVDRTALDRNVDALAGTVGRFALDLTGVPQRQS